MLDVHGTVLQVDSNGVAIDASNAPLVDLTARDGILTLASGATIDLRSADAVLRGKLELNAPRLGSNGASATGAGAPSNATGGDIAISATGPLTIRGAASVAVNAVARYTNAPADPDDVNGQLITKAWLDLIDQDSVAFINAAYGNNVAAGLLTTGLQTKLAGLTAYGSAFHLRPGVEVDSATPNGNLTVKEEIDLSGYRYGPNANRNTSSPTYGAGEAGSLVIRAGGNLAIKGSINDGFGPAPVTADDSGFPSRGSMSAVPSYYTTVDVPMTANFILDEDWRIPNYGYYNNTGVWDVSGNV